MIRCWEVRGPSGGVTIGEQKGEGGGYFNDLYDAVSILLIGVDVMLILAGNLGCWCNCGRRRLGGFRFCFVFFLLPTFALACLLRYYTL